jgi:tetratricopeptide (TPR) repeat protein
MGGMSKAPSTRNLTRSGRKDAGGLSRTERVQRLMTEGTDLLAARRAAEAAVLLLKAWELDPENVDAAINLGGAYILQGRHRQAVPVLEKACELAPDNPMVWINLAAAHLGKLPFATRPMQDAAISAFEKALALDGRAPHVNYNLGLIYLDRNELEQAALHFYRALENDPNDRDAASWLEKLRRGAGGSETPPATD